MAQSTLAGKIIGILFVVLVVPFAIYGLWRQNNNNTNVATEIEDTIIFPYVDAIREGRFESAYISYTSAAYKEKHSLEEFQAAQQKNLTEFGTLIESAKATGIVNEQTSPGEPTIYRTERLYKAEKATKNVVYELEKEGDSFKLRETYLSPTVNGLLISQIF